MKGLILVLIYCLLTSLALAQTNNNLTLRGRVTYSKPISNLWGYVDSLGNEYALVGTWYGVSIVNVTNPDSPKVVKNIPSVHPFSGSTVTREVKTYKTFAYSVNDNQTDSGLLIIDLSHLPDTNNISYHQYISHGLTVGHTLWVDEHGILYVYGFDTTGNINNLDNRGAMIFDLKQDPYNPRYITEYTTGNYVHDGFVRGDTLWACNIYSGWFSVVNADTNSFKLMAKQNSVSLRTHNAWPNSNNHYAFVTDETTTSPSYLQVYDVSNLNHIKLLGKVQSNPGSGSCIHNVQLINDTFAVTSYYTDGVVVFDVSNPTNIIEVGNYDTSPLSGPGLNGCWGVYSFLPSHNILASDIQQGLFIFSPRYKHACWLLGNVTDSVYQTALINVNVKILPSLNDTITDVFGNYQTGTADSGLHDVQFSKYGYATKTIHNVIFQPKVTDTLNVQLVADSAFNLPILVTDSFGNRIAGAQVWVTDNFQYSNFFTTDTTGTAIVTQLYNGVYDIYAGKWGYRTIKLTAQPLTISTDSLHVKIGKGYYDDFTFDFGWQSSGTAAAGLWIRTSPVAELNNGLPLNPTADVSSDIGSQCFLTGNQTPNLGVEGGTAVLTSPTFDLSADIEPNLQYYYWFTDYNSSQTPTDSLVISLSNGNTTVNINVIKPGKDSLSTWVHNSLRIKDYLPLTADMHFTATTSEVGTSGSDVVAGLDKFEITDSLANAVITLTGTENNLLVYPNPFSNAIFINSGQRLKSIEVINVLGEIVYQNSFNPYLQSPTIFNLSNLPNGIYFVRGIADGGSYVKMVVKE